VGLEPQRIAGVTPSETVHLNTGLRRIVPQKTLAIALAHQKAARAFLATGSTCCLICEDDVRATTTKGNLVSKLHNLRNRLRVQEIQWDIVRIMTQGLRPAEGQVEKTTSLAGSTAAYLLSRQGAYKLIRLPAFYHLDMVFNSAYFATFNGPSWLKTYDPEATLHLGGQSYWFWLQQPMMRCGSQVVLAWHLCLLLLMCLAIITGCPAPVRPLLGTVVAAPLLAGVLAFFVYVTHRYGLRRHEVTDDVTSLSLLLLLCSICLPADMRGPACAFLIFFIVLLEALPLFAPKIELDLASEAQGDQEASARSKEGEAQVPPR